MQGQATRAGRCDSLGSSLRQKAEDSAPDPLLPALRFSFPCMDMVIRFNTPLAMRLRAVPPDAEPTCQGKGLWTEITECRWKRKTSRREGWLSCNGSTDASNHPIESPLEACRAVG